MIVLDFIIRVVLSATVLYAIIQGDFIKEIIIYKGVNK